MKAVDTNLWTLVPRRVATTPRTTASGVPWFVKTKGREGSKEISHRSNKNGPIAGAKFQEANLVGDFRKGKATYRSGEGNDRSGSDTEKE
jgi:hypothetical protein